MLVDIAQDAHRHNEIEILMPADNGLACHVLNDMMRRCEVI